MRWLKRDMWKVGIALAGLLLFLVLMVWIPTSKAGTSERTSRLAISGPVQATPTEDATVTALNKEKLQDENNWWWSNGATILSSVLSTLVLVVGALIGFGQWRTNRNDTRTKELRDRAEERFQSAVTGLGGEKEGPKIGAAILLRTFLHPGYEQFYTQTFDLAVANLRLPRSLPSPEDPDDLPHPPEQSNDAPLPLTTLTQALIIVFKEAFPRAREELKKHSSEQNSKFKPESLDATRIQLDNAWLVGADLEQAWMALASLRKVDLRSARLSGADLFSADLREANLYQSDLREANLRNANLTGANLFRANLRGADLREANLSGANLRGVKMNNETKLWRTKMQGAKHNMKEISVLNEKGEPIFDQQGKPVTIEPTQWPQGFKLDGAVDVADEASSPSQLSVSPPPPTQSTNVQAPSTASAQVNTPPPNTDGSSSTPA